MSSVIKVGDRVEFITKRGLVTYKLTGLVLKIHTNSCSHGVAMIKPLSPAPWNGSIKKVSRRLQHVEKV